MKNTNNSEYSRLSYFAQEAGEPAHEQREANEPTRVDPSNAKRKSSLSNAGTPYTTSKRSKSSSITATSDTSDARDTSEAFIDLAVSKAATVPTSFSATRHTTESYRAPARGQTGNELTLALLKQSITAELRSLSAIFDGSTTRNLLILARETPAILTENLDGLVQLAKLKNIHGEGNQLGQAIETVYNIIKASPQTHREFVEHFFTRHLIKFVTSPDSDFMKTNDDRGDAMQALHKSITKFSLTAETKDSLFNTFSSHLHTLATDIRSKGYSQSKFLSKKESMVNTLIDLVAIDQGDSKPATVSTTQPHGANNEQANTSSPTHRHLFEDPLWQLDGHDQEFFDHIERLNTDDLDEYDCPCTPIHEWDSTVSQLPWNNADTMTGALSADPVIAEYIAAAQQEGLSTATLDLELLAQSNEHVTKPTTTPHVHETQNSDERKLAARPNTQLITPSPSEQSARPSTRNGSSQRRRTTGINPKYVLGAQGSTEYHRYKKLCRELGLIYRPSPEPETEMVEMTPLAASGQQATLSFSTLDDIGDLVPNILHASHSLDITDVKRSYIQSNHIQVLQPPGATDASTQHLHFVMAGRNPEAIQWPERKDVPNPTAFTTMLVLTQAQLKQDWHNRLPSGVGAVILPNADDRGINCRRFAALAVAHWATQNRSTEFISLQDDNVAEVRGFAETIGKLGKTEHAHTLFSFPNRTQKDGHAYTSGKLLMMNSDLLTQFMELTSNKLGLLIPPDDLFYEDIWLIRMLCDETRMTGSRCEVGGDLLKSGNDPGAALKRYSTNNQTPVDKWIQIQPEALTFINETDKALFKEFKAHITGASSRIRQSAERYRLLAQTHIAERPLVELQAAIRTTPSAPANPVELRDYQHFMTTMITQRIDEAEQRGEKSSHVALMLATGTGKTVSFLTLVQDYLAKASSQDCRRSLIIAQRIDNANDIIKKAESFDQLRGRTVWVCSDSEALDGDVLTSAPIRDSESLVVITVRRSLENALEKDSHLLDKFGLFVFDESHQFNPKIMQPFRSLSQRADNRHRIFVQASATPEPSHLKPGYLGETLYVGNYTIRTAERRDHIRSVIHDNRHSGAGNKTSPDLIKRVSINNIDDSPVPSHDVPKLLLTLLFNQLNKYQVQYQGRNKRVICYVKSSQEANACAEYIRTNPDRYNHVVASSYHSRMSSKKRKQTMQAFTATTGAGTPPNTKILFAVDMLKEASDIPGGVDFLLNMGRTHFTATQRSQIRGRAFRDSENKSIPAVFVDYSYHNPHQPQFYEDTATYKKYDYNDDTLATLTIIKTKGHPETLSLPNGVRSGDPITDLHVTHTDASGRIHNADEDPVTHSTAPDDFNLELTLNDF